jgi:hypothetical protein
VWGVAGAYNPVVESGGRPDVCWSIKCVCVSLERLSWTVARLRYMGISEPCSPDVI